MKIRLGLLAVITAAALLVAGAAATHAGTQRYSGTIAFLREPPGASFTTSQSLYVIHADGGRLQRVTPLSTPVYASAWSPNGRLIAYIDASRGSLWLVRPDGRGLLAASLVLAGGALAGAETRPIQYGSSQGVRLSVYAPGTAVFDLSRATRQVHRLLSTGNNPGCVKARMVKGHWHYSEGGGRVTHFTPRRLQFRPRLLVRPPLYRPYPAPYDGCEIVGLYGHHWDDAFGYRDAVEIWLTASGRHFFNDRAAARDLAYFVSSTRVQKTIRLSDTPEVGLAWYVQRYPGRVVRLTVPSTTVPRNVIGVWIGARTITFTATSSTGRRFYVVAKRGTDKLIVQSLDKLAYAFNRY